MNGETFTDLTGTGLANVGGLLTVDASGANGFFQQGGNSFGAAADLGTNDNQSLRFRTNNLIRASINNAGDFTVDTDTLFVRQSTGRVGIGTTNPAYKLDVQGSGYVHNSLTVHASSAGYANGLKILRRSAEEHYAIVSNVNGKALFGSGTTNTGQLSVALVTGDTNGYTERLTVLGASGNVGIGTTNPGYNLHVQSSTLARATIENTANNTAYLHIGHDTAGTAQWGTIGYSTSSDVLEVKNTSGAGTHLAIDTVGNVGIGTTTPGSKLHVLNDGEVARFDRNGSQYINVLTDSASNLIQSNGNKVFNLISDAATLNIRTNSVSPITFNTGGFERVRFAETGNVGIGTNDPSAKLHVRVSDSGATPNVNADALVVEKSSGQTGISILTGTTSTGNLFFGDSSGAAQGRIGYNHNNDSLHLATNTQNRITILSNGNVGIGTASATGKLEVLEGVGSTDKGIITSRYGNDHSSGGASFVSRFLGGTEGSPAAPTIGDTVNSFGFFTGGSAGSFFSNPSFAIRHSIVSPQGVGLTAVDTSFLVNSTATGTPFEALTLQGQTGNIGIGATDPQTKLHISTTGVDDAVTINDANGNVGAGSGISFTYNVTQSPASRIARILPYTQAGGGGDLLFQTAPSAFGAYTTKVAILRNGNVGIGTSSTAAKLDIRQGTNGADVLLARRATDTAPTGNFMRLQDAAGSDLVTIDIAGNLTVQDTVVNGTLTVNGQIITGSAAPTAVTPTAAAGTGATCNISGNDTSGTITITTGTGSSGGALCSATISFGAAPRPVISGADSISAALAPFMSATSTSFTIGVSSAPADSTAYTFNYFNVQ